VGYAGYRWRGVGQFDGVAGVFVDSADRIYVADWGNSGIVRMNDVTGAGWTVLGRGDPAADQLSNPRGLFVDGAGRVYVADANNKRIVRVNDMTGAGWVAFGMPGSPRGLFVR
jgi:streptogramin lyase